ncbi:MAG TPA: hypothetical protein VEW03_09580 [Longimicrobiaceae bacterium]|nr:hypothetical protein [Longimicrobiaceae bacterium]
MLTSSERKDWILRTIQEIARMMAALVGRKAAGDLDGALAETRAAVGVLLGPLSDLAPRLDSVTAGHMVSEPDVIAAWARVVAEEAEVHRLLGNHEQARAGERRALELALEAHLRTRDDRPELLGLISRLRASVAETDLDPRHQAALADLS